MADAWAKMADAWSAAAAANSLAAGDAQRELSQLREEVAEERRMAAQTQRELTVQRERISYLLQENSNLHSELRSATAREADAARAFLAQLASLEQELEKERAEAVIALQEAAAASQRALEEKAAEASPPASLPHLPIVLAFRHWLHTPAN